MDRKMRLLIGYDGSECANAALDDLRFAGLPTEAEVVILSVTEAWPTGPPSPAMLRSGTSEGVSTEVDIQSYFPAWNISYEGKPGSPATEILRKADDWKPDLIIVGSHG